MSFPKPVRLISKLITSIRDKEVVVLDFFSGSGTTAHAVMALNAQDGGSRKHISVQLDEPTDAKSEARKAGYNTIFEITRERIKRAAVKIKEGPPRRHLRLWVQRVQNHPRERRPVSGLSWMMRPRVQDYVPFNGMALDD